PVTPITAQRDRPFSCSGPSATALARLAPPAVRPRRRHSVSPVAPVRSRTTRPLAGSGAHRARAPRSRPGATASAPPRRGGPGRPAPAVADGPPDGGRGGLPRGSPAAPAVPAATTRGPDVGARPRRPGRP